MTRTLTKAEWSEYHQLRYDLACLRLSWLELKYRADQAREPAGSAGGVGGRFADEGRGGGHGGLRDGRLRGPLPAIPYELDKPGIVVPPAVASRLSEVGNSFYQETGQTVVVMSGDRGPRAQADAMYDKFAKGDDGHVYRDQAAMKQIKDEFDRGRAEGLTKGQTVENMQGVIDQQIDRGVLISKHMVGKAVDLRTKDLSPHHTALLMHLSHEHGFQTIHEGIPEHLHIQVH